MVNGDVTLSETGNGGLEINIGPQGSPNNVFMGSGALGAGWDLTVEAGSDLTGVDGLTLYAGMSEVDQFQNASANSGDVSETVFGIKYAMGGFTVGYQVTDEETGQTGTTGYENTSYGISFNINDDLSVSYNHTESDESGASKVSPEADSIQAAYTMGGASIRVADVNVDNGDFSAGNNSSATVVSLGLAF